MVGITLAYAGLVGPTSNHRTNGWQLRWLDEQNDIGRRANKTADKMPVLAQQMIAIWV